MTRRLAWCAVPVLALLLVACGDDDDSSSRAATAEKGDAFCTAAAKVDELTDAMSGALMSGEPQQFETALGEVIAASEAAQKLAPTDIVKQVTKSVDGFKRLSAGLKKFDYDFEAAAADPEFAALLEDEELDANGTEVDEYLEAKCGIIPS